MRCVLYTQWISRMLDRSLPENELRELEEHLSCCSRCRAELLLQKKIRDALAGPLPPGLSADFTEQVTRKAAALAPRVRRPRRWPALVPAVALSAAAVALLSLSPVLARLVPWPAESLVGSLLAPVARVWHALFSLLPGPADLGLDRIPALPRSGDPLVATVVALLLAGVSVVWAFRYVFAFLRE